MSVPAASSPASPPTEHLPGLVERVTFHNEENGFCVLRLKARGQRDLITIIGHAATIAAGEFVQATGSWTTDRTHGLQLSAPHEISLPFERKAAQTGGKQND